MQPILKFTCDHAPARPLGIRPRPAHRPGLPGHQSLPAGALCVAALLLLGAGCAYAGTTGTEFQTMYTTLLNWITGYLGKAIAIAAFILGAGIGVARSSPIPALVGVVFALFMVYVPSIIDGIMTAVI
jgi:conjugal transfer pilus assembly protein TraA